MLPFQLFIFLVLQVSSFESVFSAEYSRPTKYFINCGSKSSTEFVADRAFVGDDSDPVLKLSHGKGQSVKDKNPSETTPLLYQTARVYQKPASYELEIGRTGTYIVRFHFFAFSSPSFNLSDAVFDVYASGFSLLSGFSTNRTANNPVFEFLLTIAAGKVGLYFVPTRNSSFAFVNAIELFPAPDSFVPSSAPWVTLSGINGSYTRLSSAVLHTVHRVNVGGRKITPESDTLWRTWTEDDLYLIGPRDSMENKSYNGKLDYSSGNATEFIAPDYVYKTARFLSTLQGNLSTINWAFRVNRNASQHLVRVHFCDIISPAANSFFFSLFIYENFERIIYPYEEIPNLAAPFYLDFAVDPKGAESINVRIALKQQNISNPSAFLNGLEIFEVSNKSGPVPPENRPASKPRIGLIIGLPLSFALVLGTAIAAFLIYKRRKAKPDRNPAFFLYGSSGSKENSAMPKLPPNLSLKIPFADIQEATGNFDDKLRIGSGGFGMVYRGTLGGCTVAVKRSKPGHDQGFAEFKTEIIVLSKIRHRHLVSLIGYCDEQGEMILVYEFMANGTLREHLYGSEGKPGGSEFPWEKRLEICIGAAAGLEYLHTDAGPGILHRDIKSTNILLDEDFEAKVADFGLSEYGIADPEAPEIGLKGSFGYFDPEYFESSLYTAKSDVYSFGVVLFEVICARRAIFALSPEERNVNLVKWASARHRMGKLGEIVDPALAGQIDPNSLRVAGDLAAKCVSASGSDRPTMRDVVYSLKYALQLQRLNFEETGTDLPLEPTFPAGSRAGHRPNEDVSPAELSGFSNTF